MKLKNSRIISLIFAFVIMVAGVTAPSITVKAAAGYLHKLHVPFGMEIRKNYTLNMKCAKGITKKVDYSLGEVKKTKKGKKTHVELSIMYWLDERFSADEVDTIVNNYKNSDKNEFGPDHFFVLVNGKTGKLIVDESKYSFKGKVESVTKDRFYGTNGNYFDEPIVMIYNIKFDYPSSDKNVCFGISGGSILLEEEGETEEQFWQGKVPFGKTAYYKKGKKNSRWIDLSKL